MIDLAVALLLCLLVGAALDRSLFGAPGLGVIERFGRSLMFGFGSIGTLSILADGLGLGVTRVTVVGLSLFMMVLLRLRPFKKQTIKIVAEEPPISLSLRVVGLALLVFAGLMLAFAVYTGWIRPAYQFDALVRWMFKAKALAMDGTLLGPLSTDSGFHFTHQRYPPLVSHVANLPFLVSGEYNDRIASAVFPWYAVALVCVVYGTMARSTSWFKATIAAAWVASLPLIAFRDGMPPLGVPAGAGAFSALADIPFTLFATGAVMAAKDAVEGRRGRAYLETGLMLAFATLTKNEGLPLVAAVVVAVLLCAKEKPWRNTALVVVIALGIYVLLWGRLAATIPALDENYPGRLNLKALSEGLPRVPMILSRLLKETVFLPSWNLTWPAVIGLLLISGRLALDRVSRLLLIVCVLQVASYVLAYTITAWTSLAIPAVLTQGDPIPSLLNLTLGRLLLHITPLAIVAALRAAPLTNNPSRGM